MKLRRRQGGFAYLAAVVLLIVVAGVVAAMLRLTTAQQATANDAILIARAGQAARGGVEWIMYRIGAITTAVPATAMPATLCTETPNPPAVQVAPAATTLTDFQADTGFRVTVTCSYTAYKEGIDMSGASVTKHIYTIGSTACNGTTAGCPDNAGAGAADYTERRRVATMCVTSTGGACY
jgi:MSHA biogenesis protein MshP